MASHHWTSFFRLHLAGLATVAGLTGVVAIMLAAADAEPDAVLQGTLTFLEIGRAHV